MTRRKNDQVSRGRTHWVTLADTGEVLGEARCEGIAGETWIGLACLIPFQRQHAAPKIHGDRTALQPERFNRESFDRWFSANEEEIRAATSGKRTGW